MNMLKKSLFVIGAAVMATIIVSGSAFADMALCLHQKNPKLSTKWNVEHKVDCAEVKLLNGEYLKLFAEEESDCDQVPTLAADPDSCLNSPDQVKIEKKKTTEEETKKVPLSDENVEYFKACIGEGTAHPKLSLEKDETHVKKCPDSIIDKNQIVELYVADLADCAEGMAMVIMPHVCADVPDTNTITTFQPCVGDEKKPYPNLSLVTPGGEYPIRCPVVNWKGKLIGFSAKTGADCSQTQELVNNSGCYTQSFNRNLITRIISGAISLVVITIVVLIAKKASKKNKTNPTATSGNEPKNNPFQPAKPGEAEWTITPAEPAEPETPTASAEPIDPTKENPNAAN